jgi:hypothetical protein
MMMVACLHIVVSKQVALFVVLVAAAVDREQAMKIVSLRLIGSDWQRFVLSCLTRDTTPSLQF